MIKINNIKSKNSNLIQPKDMWNTPYGTVYQMYEHGVPSNNYFISTGINDRLIYIWYDDENQELRFSSQDLKDLKGFNSHIKCVEVDADIEVNLVVRGMK